MACGREMVAAFDSVFECQGCAFFSDVLALHVGQLQPAKDLSKYALACPSLPQKLSISSESFALEVKTVSVVMVSAQGQEVTRGTQAYNADKGKVTKIGLFHKQRLRIANMATSMPLLDLLSWPSSPLG